MTVRCCLDCGVHTDNGTRCRACTPTTAQRGYGSKWQKLRARILTSNPHCHYCGQAATQVDHHVPKAQGGTDHPSNLVPACAQCNAAKGGSTDKFR